MPRYLVKVNGVESTHDYRNVHLALVSAVDEPAPGESIKIEVYKVKGSKNDSRQKSVDEG